MKVRLDTVRKHLTMIAVAWMYAVCTPPAAMAESVAPDEGTLKWFACGGWPPGCEAAVVWGDWEKSISGWYIRAPKGYTFPPHSHTSPERIVVLRGRITGAAGGGEEMVSPNMYWAFPGGQVHWARCEDACLMYITYDAAFDVKFVK